MNFRDGSGRWQPIDSTLVPVTGGYQNKANDVRVHLPATLEAPVRVSSGDLWATFQLVGAGAQAVASGATATYADALPGVTVRYTAVPDGVKEELVLRDAMAPTEFRFLVASSGGLVPRANRRTIQFVDVSGRPYFAFRPPYSLNPGWEELK